MLIGMCHFIIPQFAQLYESFNVKLPWFTAALIKLSVLMINDWPWMLMAVIIGSLMLWLAYKNYAIKVSQVVNAVLPFKRRWQRWQFWHAMAILLQSGTPFLNAGKICYTLLPHGKQQRLFLYCMHQIQHGQKPSIIFQQVKLFDLQLQHVFVIGETSGQLMQLLNNYVEQEQLNLQEKLDQFKIWFEPIMMCIMGVVLGVVLLALYLPMVQLGKYI
jgi:type II secretory pathway component PulF